MRRFISILAFLSVVFALSAQITGFDLQRISDEDILGSSRYVGLAGAMAALGGDVSAVNDNAAAIGVFRHSEASLSINCDVFGEKSVKVNMPSLNAVIHFERPKTSHNIMLAFQRRAIYHSDWQSITSNLDFENSQTNLMADLSEGLTYKDFELSGIAYLAYAGFDGYLIDTVPGAGGNRWQSVESGNFKAQLSYSETGTLDDYSFGWGMNKGHRFYLGVNAMIRSVSYSKTSAYYEGFQSGNRYSVGGSAIISGVGIGLNVGVIWRPVEMLRLAAAVQTPVACILDFDYSGNLKSVVADESYNQIYETPSSYEQQCNMPMKIALGAALQFGRRGLLSAEYDYRHISRAGMRDQHLAKIGAEWACTNNCFFDLGYAASLYGKYYNDLNVNVMEWDSPRLDAEQVEAGMRHYYSAGFSFRNRWIIAGLAYQYSLQHTKLWAHEYQSAPMIEIPDRQHRVVLTLGFRYRD